MRSQNISGYSFDWVISVLSSCWVWSSDEHELTPRWKCFSQCFFYGKTEQLSIIFPNTSQETFTQVLAHKETCKCQCSMLRQHGHSVKASFAAIKCKQLKSFNIYLFAYDLAHSFWKLMLYCTATHWIINMFFQFQKKKTKIFFWDTKSWKGIHALTF